MKECSSLNNKQIQEILLLHFHDLKATCKFSESNKVDLTSVQFYLDHTNFIWFYFHFPHLCCDHQRTLLGN